MRNGYITNYTVKYTGNVSMTMTAGSFYPEDPCTAPHSVYLPVIPDGKITIEIWANAEFKGDKATTVFLADRAQMSYGFSSNSSTTVTDSKPVIVASATLGSVIVILIVAATALFLKR
ncbi:uncharacterized protein LOC124274866 isoform X2 [Haliotis rubra]|uniref:uncharacterized protein LOC124274866 isoform X2 n=1 Tax=Haliotis rubra TaxID=36100 RepID=UPI001EE5C1AB|nr:uncharacterized protein LOC124274866 isoform X2 [Haliotis rubra]